MPASNVKRLAKITCAFVSICVAIVGLGAWLFFACGHQSQLPTENAAERFFDSHKQELASLAASVRRQPNNTLVSGNAVADGADPTSGSYQSSVKLLKRIGAQFVRNSDGAIDIYFWGNGCAICHDSYMGCAYIPAGAALMQHATVVKSVEDKTLPKDKNGSVANGYYIRPLQDSWYIFRREED